MNNNVVFLGCTNDYGRAFSACNTKVEFMARGLSECGDRCYIHNGGAGSQTISIPKYEMAEGIGTVVNYSAKGAWFISPFRNHRLLVNDLKKWYRSDMNNWVIVEAPYLPFYYLNIRAARESGYKVGVIAHEWLGSFNNKNSIVRWLNHKYADVFGYSVDVILPISEYIIEKIQKFNKPYLKVPVEADFSSPILSQEKEPFFLYCVSAEYLRVIGIVLEGFMTFCQKHQDYKMILVLTGSQLAIDKVYSIVRYKQLDDFVEIRHKIPYKELLNLYGASLGLVVPLDPNCEQDKARFSQKIAEYLSSGTAIISNYVGEVRSYFSDKENIILCDYSSNGFYSAFSWIASNKYQADMIGKNGFELGKNNFDYKLCGKQLHEFLLTH